MSDLDPGVGSAHHPVGERVDASTALDLDAIERDLRDVESALARLADGTYFPQPDASEPGTNATGPTTDAAAETASDTGMGV